MEVQSIFTEQDILEIIEQLDKTSDNLDEKKQIICGSGVIQSMYNVYGEKMMDMFDIITDKKGEKLIKKLLKW